MDLPSSIIMEGVPDRLASSPSFQRVACELQFLYTAILGIEARFCARQPPCGSVPHISDETLDSIAALAYAHVGFSLCGKEHQLDDVQALLLLST